MTETAETRDNQALLKKNVGYAANDLFNAISTRRNHPTFGYTKASIRQRLARLEGLAYAYYIMCGGFSVNLDSAAPEGMAWADVDPAEVYSAFRKCMADK